MRGVNKAIIVGNLGDEPAVNSGVTRISVATTSTWKDKQTGEQKEKTEWHRVVGFGRTGEIMAEYLHKGSQVYIEGNIQTNKWQDKEGNDRYTTEIIARDMQMLGSRSEPANEQPRGRAEPAPPADDFNDDIPFN